MFKQTPLSVPESGVFVFVLAFWSWLSFDPAFFVVALSWDRRDLTP